MRKSYKHQKNTQIQDSENENSKKNAIIKAI